MTEDIVQFSADSDKNLGEVLQMEHSDHKLEQEPPLLAGVGLSKTYLLGEVRINALNQVNIEVFSGEFIAISGPSGSGKTTLLNLLGCLDEPTSGELTVDGKDVRNMSDNQLSRFRARTLGFIFQNFNLIPVMNALENVEYPLRLMRWSADSRRERACEMLEQVGLADRMLSRPNALSGGQRQRVAIARALACAPRVIIADEPTANLDSQTSRQIIDLMQHLNQQSGSAFLFSTHDPAILEQAQRRLRMHDGNLEPAV